MGDGVWVTFANYGVSDVSLYAKKEVEKTGDNAQRREEDGGNGPPFCPNC